MGVHLIDTDILVYSMGHIADKHPEPHRQYKMLIQNKMNWIMKKASDVMTVEQTRCFLTSDDKSNFRFDIYPQYKANRSGSEKPSMYHQIREYIQEKYDAEMVYGMEADDKMSIIANEIYNKQSSRHICLISSADKDMRMVPGLHYEMGDAPVYEVHNPGALHVYRGSGRKVWGTGLKWFYYQLLVGDTADNIPGLDMSPFDAYTFLSNNPTRCVDYGVPESLYLSVLDAYLEQGKTKDELIRNARLLWLKTREDEPLWEPPV